MTKHLFSIEQYDIKSTKEKITNHNKKIQENFENMEFVLEERKRFAKELELEVLFIGFHELIKNRNINRYSDCKIADTSQKYFLIKRFFSNLRRDFKFTRYQEMLSKKCRSLNFPKTWPFSDYEDLFGIEDNFSFEFDSEKEKYLLIYFVENNDEFGEDIGDTYCSSTHNIAIFEFPEKCVYQGQVIKNGYVGFTSISHSLVYGFRPGNWICDLIQILKSIIPEIKELDYIKDDKIRFEKERNIKNNFL